MCVPEMSHFLLKPSMGQRDKAWDVRQVMGRLLIALEAEWALLLLAGLAPWGEGGCKPPGRHSGPRVDPRCSQNSRWGE